VTNDIVNLWSNASTTSILLWLALGVTVLYLGRKQAHQIFSSSGRTVYRTLRMWGFTLGALEKRITQRNREVLLAHGAKQMEKAIERELARVHDIVQRDLSQYPALHRQIRDAIDKIEADYQNAADAAPLPPAWKDVVQTITSLPPSGDPAVNKILQNVKDAVEDSHTKTLKAYKQASAQRHKLLSEMQPYWRKLNTTMEEVDGKVSSIDERAKVIDEQMDQYREIRAGSDTAADSLASSAMTQFFISGLVLVVACLGGLINFQLIAVPMSEMVGGASYIGDMRTSDIAALVIILIEIAMGLFLVESLRITQLFPIISSMDDRMRKRMIWVTFSILSILACIEASLAYMRDLLAQDREALNQALAGSSTANLAIQAQFRWIPSIGQMVMGLMLPFALAFIAIPLESFIFSFRTVLGTLAIFVLRLLRVTVRVLGGVFNHLATICRHLFDLIIVVPLGIERLIKGALANRAEKSTAAEDDWFDADNIDQNSKTDSAHEKTGKSKSRRKKTGSRSVGDVDLSSTVFE